MDGNDVFERWLRRCVTIPGVLLAAVAAVILLPLTAAAAASISLVPRWRGMLRTVLLATAVVALESIGLAACAWVGLRYRHRPAEYVAANYALQHWWADRLWSVAAWLFQIRITVTGTEALCGKPALVLPRHASVADTILPIALYARPCGVRLRYVMKQELLADPCLDVMGHRLPNLFVARNTGDNAQAVGVARLLHGLEANGSVLIFPEGTRFTAAKRDALKVSWRFDPERRAQLQRWPDLLPPRLGGTLALLGSNPGLDVLFCAHVGFESAADLRALVNGAWQRTHARVHFWRIPFDELPTTDAGLKAFVFTQWDRMQDTVVSLRNGATPQGETT